MIRTASFSLAAILASVLLTATGQGSPLAVAHLAFAAGVVPLIGGAMLYFVPVLTRTGDPGRWMRRLPDGLTVCALIAAAGMQGLLPRFAIHAAATADLAAAIVLLNWIAARARLAVGEAHPCWRWYAVAQACLALALAAVLLMPWLTEHGQSLRLFHLHLNTLGLVGLSALGTLPVLLPTALGQPDPQAAGWLRRRLWQVAGGALTVAAGAAIAWPYAVPGALLVFLCALGLLGQWARRFGVAALWRDGAAASLLAAVAGLLFLLLAGLLHGAGFLPAVPAVRAWALGFLLPLITGAVSQLLPVWRWPGSATPQRAAMRGALTATGQARALLFTGGAVLLLFGQDTVAALAAVGGMALFAVGFARAMFGSGPAR